MQEFCPLRRNCVWDISEDVSSSDGDADHYVIFISILYLILKARREPKSPHVAYPWHDITSKAFLIKNSKLALSHGHLFADSGHGVSFF
jgi:hypothetical protein